MNRTELGVLPSGPSQSTLYSPVPSEGSHRVPSASVRARSTNLPRASTRTTCSWAKARYPKLKRT